MTLIWDRKDVRRKDVTRQRIPLLNVHGTVSGCDACKIVEEQGCSLSRRDGRIFLHFHDLRHERTSAQREAGFTTEQVVPVTGHKAWKMLRRSSHLQPEAPHAIRAARAA